MIDCWPLYEAEYSINFRMKYYINNMQVDVMSHCDELINLTFKLIIIEILDYL